MEVSKIKRTKQGTTVEIVASNAATDGGDSHPEDRTLKNCPDGSPALDSAFESLRPEVCRILGFTRKDEKERVRVTGVSVSRDANRNRAFIVHTMFRTNVGEASLNVPRLREPVEGAEGGETVLSDTGLKQVEKVLAAALDYYEGDREQTSLDLDSGDEMEAAEA